MQGQGPENEHNVESLKSTEIFMNTFLNINTWAAFCSESETHFNRKKENRICRAPLLMRNTNDHSVPSYDQESSGKILKSFRCSLTKGGVWCSKDEGADLLLYPAAVCVCKHTRLTSSLNWGKFDTNLPPLCHSHPVLWHFTLWSKRVFYIAKVV